MKVVAYGGGFFCNRHWSLLNMDFCVVAIVDQGGVTPSGAKIDVFKSIKHLKSTFDFIMIMTEKYENIYGIIQELKTEGITPDCIKLGISYYGYMSKYFRFSIDDDYNILISDGNTSQVIAEESHFAPTLKLMMERKVDYQAELLKRDLQSLYEDKLKIMWMDGHVTCADHEIDACFRFEKYGFFNWGYTAVFTMMSINKYSNPYILDLGCGDGYYYRHFYRFIDGVHYIGCDLDHHNIDRALELNAAGDYDYMKTSSFIIGDIVEAMPLPHFKKSFDVVIWSGSFCAFNNEDRIRILNSIEQRTEDKSIVVMIDFFSREKSGWECCINPVNDVKKVKELFEKFFRNVFLYADEKEKMLIVMASNGELPFK